MIRAHFFQTKIKVGKFNATNEVISHSKGTVRRHPGYPFFSVGFSTAISLLHPIFFIIKNCYDSKNI